MLKSDNVIVGLLDVNCYLVWDNETNQGLVIDPGGDGDEIVTAISNANFHPQAILLTHAHFDHIGAVNQIASHYGIPVWCHKDDFALYHSQDNAMLPWFPPVPDLPEPVTELPAILSQLGGTIIHTPGHTPGSVCIYFSANNLLFSGDTLFCAGVGRTDLPGGSELQLHQSLNQKLFTLPQNTLVFPGHGEDTTISAETP